MEGNRLTASPIKEHYRPAVKFRKIDKAVLERLQTGASDTTLAQAEVVEFQDDDSDVDEPSTEPEGNSADRGEVGGEKLAFVIDPQIDINSRALLDMISEEAMVQVDQPLLSAHEEAVVGNCKVTIDEAFDNW